MTAQRLPMQASDARLVAGGQADISLRAGSCSGDDEDSFTGQLTIFA